MDRPGWKVQVHQGGRSICSEQLRLLRDLLQRMHLYYCQILLRIRVGSGPRIAPQDQLSDASTVGSFATGLLRLVWSRAGMVNLRYAGQTPQRLTERPARPAPSNCCLVTPRLTALCTILALSWGMLSASPSKSTYDLPWRAAFPFAAPKLTFFFILCSVRRRGFGAQRTFNTFDTGNQCCVHRRRNANLLSGANDRAVNEINLGDHTLLKSLKN